MLTAERYFIINSNPFTEDRLILALSKRKVFADDKFTLYQITKLHTGPNWKHRQTTK